MNQQNTKLFFSVGEPSGDLHASNLLQHLRRFHPRFECRGFGGQRLLAAGCKLDFELTDLAVVGFVEVLPKLREFFRVADIASEVFEHQRPDAVILVDFPGFNWHIAKRAKRFDIPVFYYLPPQLWAWGGWRIHKMKRYVDHILCNLPFEQDWYSDRGMAVDYVGHPFFDEVQERRLDPRLLADWGEWEGCQVAVLPGSRSREVRNIWPMQLETIRELARRHPKTRFLIACLKDHHCLWCRNQLRSEDANLNIHFFVGKTSELIEIADCCLIKSGSVSLELMARGTPAVVVYHVSRAFYSIGRRLSNLTSMTLPNMIAGKTIMPEFLAIGHSKAATIERSIAAMDRLIGDTQERARQKQELYRLASQFARPGASAKAASLVMQHLGLNNSQAETPDAVTVSDRKAA